MAGYPDPWVQTLCKLALAVDRAAARLDFANLHVAPEFARADTVDDPSHRQFGKPLFSAQAARQCVEEELTALCSHCMRFHDAFASCRHLAEVMDQLTEAVQWRARKSSFTPDRGARRLLVNAGKRGRTKRGRYLSARRNQIGGSKGRVETWLIHVHAAAKHLGITSSCHPKTTAAAWQRWKSKLAAPWNLETRMRPG